jgi:hypothetical protein
MVTRRTKRQTPRRRATPVTVAPPVYPPGTLGEWLDYIVPDASDSSWIPMWPPDAFAVGAAILRRTGGYLDLVNGDDLRGQVPVLEPRIVRDAGLKWRRELNDLFDTESPQQGKKRKRIREVCPPEIQKAWATLRSNGNVALADVRTRRDMTAAAVTLCTVSDAACEGLGVGLDPESKLDEVKTRKSPFLAFAERNAAKEPVRLRSFCLQIPPSKLAVLGKRHTPQRGCSIRSLTHHLSLYTPTEIQAVWPAPIQKTQEEIDVFNILLLPWPAEVADGHFHALRASGQQRYFDYRPGLMKSPNALTRVQQALKRAEKYADRVHAVVLPELALDETEFDGIERFVANKRAILVSGVRKAACPETCWMPANKCVIQPYGLSVQSDNKQKPTAEELRGQRRTQSKHHRWCLERRQILQYKLGGRLPASRDCWEFMHLGQREIHFVTLASWLTITTLICEDLARQEPVTEVVRAVGPNLIFALLMDGPQLKSRWSSRYASVLAEDPGCSVLSLTSLGMSKRSRPSDLRPEDDKSNFVALWRDAVYGEQEICLDKDHDACVLSLVCQTRDEYTIEGANLSRPAHFPVFAGCQSFSSRPARPKMAVK